jgi:hypothetical protein
VPARPLVTLRIEPKLLAAIDERAESEHRTRSNLLQLAARRYVFEHTERAELNGAEREH